MANVPPTLDGPAQRADGQPNARPRDRRFSTEVVVGTLCLVAVLLLVALDVALGRSVARELELSRHVAEIHRLDEVLTMSARLYAATHDPRHRERYTTELPHLEAALRRALEVAGTADVYAEIASTSSANRALVELEKEAFARCDAGDGPAALASLQSDEYLQLKQRYAEGLNTAFELARAQAARETNLRRGGLLAIAVAFLLGAAMMMVAHARAREAAHEHQRRAAQLEALRVTLRTVMDAVNNGLHSLQLFRMRAEDRGALTGEELDQFDQTLRATSERLRQMGEMNEYRARREGSGDILDV
ncbi:hypothetical protein L6R52_04870 [Myxococcota bacterium]|nr:hypothetical protein [Myxococcota bacterium]